MLELMYITNDPEVAEIVDRAGVERIWIDLETKGKEARQLGMNTVKSNHSLSDIRPVKEVLNTSFMQVRINPISIDTEKEINAVIENGADYIMLPYYKTVDEVRQFVNLVAGRAKTILLLETREARECLDETLAIQGVDEIHVGLNDLHLSYGKRFMFELLADGTVEEICDKVKASGKNYGFGGIAKLGGGTLPSEKIIAEHYRLGSTRAILSRSFCTPGEFQDYAEFEKFFVHELKKLRQYEKKLAGENSFFFIQNQKDVKNTVLQIVENSNKKQGYWKGVS